MYGVAWPIKPHFMKKIMQSGRLLSALLILSVFLLPACKKQIAGQADALSKDPTSTEKIIHTPFGPMAASRVHYIDSGYHLAWLNGHLLKVHTASGKMVEDFGQQQPDSAIKAQPRTITGTAGAGVIKPGLNSGWITFAENANTFPATYFSTMWAVPTNPTGTDGQLLYLFNGMEDGIAHILQPVLQFGNNNAWGGYYWTINNWYASCATCQAYYATPATVSAGTLLQGVIQQVGNSTSSGYTYTSSFANQSIFNALTVFNVPQLQYLYETMEAYGMQQPNDYPADVVCSMNDIQALNGSTNIQFNWQAYNPGSDATVGQHTVIASNGSPVVPSSQVELYFHNPPPPPPNAVISILNQTSFTIGILFEGQGANGGTYNFLAGPGTTTAQVPAGTYNIILNSGGGRCYYEFFTNPGVASDFSDQPVVTIPNVTFAAGNFSALIGNAGD